MGQTATYPSYLLILPLQVLIHPRIIASSLQRADSYLPLPPDHPPTGTIANNLQEADSYLPLPPDPITDEYKGTGFNLMQRQT